MYIHTYSIIIHTVAHIQSLHKKTHKSVYTFLFFFVVLQAHIRICNIST